MIYTTIFLIQTVVTLFFCFIASIFDIKRNIIPDKLSLFLIIFGIISNLILSALTSNIKYVSSSIISMSLTYIICYLFWKLKIWGGGDVKLLTAIATVIPFSREIKFFNIFPILSFYPFSFSVIINAILVSFPFLLLVIFYLNIKNSIFKNNGELFINLLNYKNFLLFVKINFNKLIRIDEVEEGMIVNEYFFNNREIIPLINNVNGNLQVYKDSSDSNFDFYFKSFSSGGLTKTDANLLKIMYAQGFINSKISIKLGFPFAPSITLGLIIALVYGDLIAVLVKNFFLVI